MLKLYQYSKLKTRSNLWSVLCINRTYLLAVDFKRLFVCRASDANILGVFPLRDATEAVCSEAPTWQLPVPQRSALPRHGLDPAWTHLRSCTTLQRGASLVWVRRRQWGWRGVCSALLFGVQRGWLPAVLRTQNACVNGLLNLFACVSIAANGFRYFESQSNTAYWTISQMHVSVETFFIIR